MTALLKKCAKPCLLHRTKLIHLLVHSIQTACIKNFAHNYKSMSISFLPADSLPITAILKKNI